MTTDKKKESNRMNARKSTGPRSEAGKAVVSRNALKHGLLSRNLVIEEESREEFSELLQLLMEEFQPAGLVEHALVERVGIALWRQRRLVRAEAAQVSLNQQRFSSPEKEEVCAILGYDDIGEKFLDMENEPEESYLAGLRASRDKWQSFVDEEVADTDEPFDHLPVEYQQYLLNSFGVRADGIEFTIKVKYNSWANFFEKQIQHHDFLINNNRRIREVSRLVRQSHALPSKTDLLARYQTALDNDLYKALKALREAQAWQQARTSIDVKRLSQGEDRDED
ncbi:MAG: hypothetical protein A4E69_02536 [Syntrophus sp. PtaB.Bin138]|nr:MAG: hypothetical protein A4E69_02536 [Syntrophus sp. PtaB.Bin138]